MFFNKIRLRPKAGIGIILTFVSLVAIGFWWMNSQKSIHISAYFWKSQFKLNPFNRDFLSSHEVKKLYVHICDIDLDEKGRPFPKNKIQFEEPFPQQIQFIPVVYITERTFRDAQRVNPDELAKKVFQLTVGLEEIMGVKMSGMQIDCDWTETSSKPYFSFLKTLKSKLGNRELSCTVRLHQTKYPEKTGVPPVDRATLMFYNIGKIRQYNSSNSIYSPEIAAPYLVNLRDYPIKLHYALPAFAWGLQYSDGNVGNVLSENQLSGLDTCALFFKHAEDLYRCKQAGIYSGYYYKKGDLVKVEQVSSALCLQAAEQLAPHVNSSDFEVIFYHLSSPEFSQYEPAQIKAICSIFN